MFLCVCILGGWGVMLLLSCWAELQLVMKGSQYVVKADIYHSLVIWYQWNYVHTHTQSTKAECSWTLKKWETHCEFSIIRGYHNKTWTSVHASVNVKMWIPADVVSAILR